MRHLSRRCHGIIVVVAMYHVENGEYDRAIADYTEAIRIKPDYAEAYHNRGVAHAGERRARPSHRRLHGDDPAPAGRRQGVSRPRRFLRCEGRARPRHRRLDGSSSDSSRTIADAFVLAVAIDYAADSASTTARSPTLPQPSRTARPRRLPTRSCSIRGRRPTLLAGEHDRAYRRLYPTAVRLRRSGKRMHSRWRLLQLRVTARENDRAAR